MSHLAGHHAGHTRHVQSSPRDRMAIGFLAPQHADTSRHPPQPAIARQDLRAATAAHPQLASLAYGVNVQASMMNVHASQAISQSQRWPPTQVPSLSSSQTSTPPASPDHGRCDDLEKPPREHQNPRERRDPYSEEMQFFIMFARIYKEQDWRKIEDDFERTFNQRRPRDGLTAVYYRIRNKWGMQQVLKSGPDKYNTDNAVMEARARGLPRHFLRQIGYTD